MKRLFANIAGYAAMTGFYLFAGCVAYAWWRGA